MDDRVPERDLSRLAVPRWGRLVETGDRYEPYRLVDADGAAVVPVALFFQELLAAGKAAATVRSYGMDLLRWWRFLHAIEVPWDRATRVDARDFSCWIQRTVKPRATAAKRRPARSVGAPNPVTGKTTPGPGYAPSTVAHSETVLRRFYDLHRDAGSGPLLNPFPLDLARRSGRAHAHHNPVEAWAPERTGRYRPTVPRRIPRSIPDEWFNTLFAALSSNRDRAMIAFWISSGVRASELIGVWQCDVDPGQQLISVVRKGSRARQQVPASADAFVWLRLYQQELHGLVPRSRTQPVWWTLRRPFTPLTYHGAHRMFERVNATFGADWTLHDLRHSAAARMVRDPALTLTDVQWVLGHAHLTTTEIYLAPRQDEVVAGILAHHARRADRHAEPVPPPPAPGYDPEALDVLFGRSS
ncbi:site-specific integrase [Streptomyces sp. NEAU-S7GS2]|uniref:tyrosine-type recombinase/integrase n=1 Tax=Streptomyces sp. NEAU-S7GS2 TaxID=2202000 RepID=UPI000D6EF26C|nr:site-specific integrase [Streptomyces sp. NEAU-S7GS2]AWN25093.1 integrase [Streptomyces sp. NEAU-S7GS2]